MNLFTKWIIDNLDKLSLRVVSDVRNFFHRFIDDRKVLAAVQAHTGWQPDNGMSQRICQYLIGQKDNLHSFNQGMYDDITKLISNPTPAKEEEATATKEVK